MFFFPACYVKERMLRRRVSQVDCFNKLPVSKLTGYSLRELESTTSSPFLRSTSTTTLVVESTKWMLYCAVSIRY
jgi:hypothetical protein